MLASRMASCPGVAAFCSTIPQPAGAGGARPANHAAVARGVVHHGAQQDACRGPADPAAACSPAAPAFPRAAAGHRRRGSCQVAVQPGQRFPPHHQGVAGAFLLRLLDESDPRPGSGDPATRTSSAWCPTTTKMRSAGAMRSAVSTTCSISALAAGAVQHLGLARFHARAEPGGENHNCHGNPHQLYYLPASAFLRQFHHHRGGGAGSCRTLPVCCARLPAITFSPIL
jgi:hypothetical protein